MDTQPLLQWCSLETLVTYSPGLAGQKLEDNVFSPAEVHLSAPILSGAPLNPLPAGIQTKQYRVQAEYSMLPIDPTDQQWSRLVTLGALTTVLAEWLALVHTEEAVAANV